MVLIPKLCSQVASPDPMFPCSHVPIGFPKCPRAASNLVFPCSQWVSQAQYFSCSRWFPCSQASSQATYFPRLVSFETHRSGKNLVQETVYTFRQEIGENGRWRPGKLRRRLAPACSSQPVAHRQAPRARIRFAQTSPAATGSLRGD